MPALETENPSPALAGYTVLRRLGAGATTVVDLARDPGGELVALKRLRAPWAVESVRRLEREAEVLAALRHPNIVGLREVLAGTGEVPVVVLEFVPGGSLADRLVSGALEAAEVHRLAVDLARALAAAHRRGVLHRDLKPANVLLASDGGARLADFGVARAERFTDGLTMPGRVPGTPGYVAPERLAGAPASPASDMYGLGATLRAAAGASPLPDELLATIAALLAPDPLRRPTATEMLVSLTGAGPSGTPPLPGRAPARVAVALPPSPVRRRWGPLVVGGVGAVVAGAAATSAVFLWVGRDHPTAGTLPSVVESTLAPGKPAVTMPIEVGQPCPSSAPYLLDTVWQTDGSCAGGAAAVGAAADGSRCLPLYLDLDGDVTSGCEAQQDAYEPNDSARSAARIEADDAVHATLLLGEDEDWYAIALNDGGQLLCDGEVTLTLDLPADVVAELTLWRDGNEVGRTAAGPLVVSDPTCFSDDGGEYLVSVEASSGSSADEYVLEVTGHF